MCNANLKIKETRCLVSILAAFSIGAFGASPFASAATQDQDLIAPSVIVRGLELHLSTPASAQRLLDRLGEAALEACGGSVFSLREVKAAIKASSCWRDAMAGAIGRIDSPQLTLAFERAKSRRAPI